MPHTPIKLFSAFVWLMVSVVPGYAQRKTKQPNIVVLLADDLGWNDLSTNQTSLGHGSRYHQTPQIDRLARQGMSFGSMYASQNCSPSRACLLSGQYAPRTEIYNVGSLNRGDTNSVIKPIPQLTNLKPGITTLAETLRKAGYVTAHFGKWHLGASRAIEVEHGFDVSYSGDEFQSRTIDGSGNHFIAEQKAPNRWEFNLYGSHMAQFAQPYTQPYIDAYLQPYANQNNPRSLEGTPKHINDAMADATADFLSKQRTKLGQDKPFLMYVAFQLVHVPIQPRSDLLAKYEQLPLTDPRHVHVPYAAFVEQLDQVVGRVMDQLKDPNGDGDQSDDVTDNTIVLFLSDNGGPGNGKKDTPSMNTPLRGYKGTQYEGGIRVPMIVRWPGKIKAGTINHEALHLTDLYPTLASLASAPLPDRTVQAVDGESFVPILRSEADSIQRKSLFFHFPGYMDSRGFPVSVIIRDFGRERYKLFYYYEPQRYELYRISEDIGEKKDLLADELTVSVKTIANTMRDELRQWLERTKPRPLTYRSDGRAVPLPGLIAK